MTNIINKLVYFLNGISQHVTLDAVDTVLKTTAVESKTLTVVDVNGANPKSVNQAILSNLITLQDSAVPATAAITKGAADLAYDAAGSASSAESAAKSYADGLAGNYDVAGAAASAQAAAISTAANDATFKADAAEAAAIAASALDATSKADAAEAAAIAAAALDATSKADAAEAAAIAAAALDATSKADAAEAAAIAAAALDATSKADAAEAAAIASSNGYTDNAVDAINATMQLEWQDSVKSVLNAPPVSPASGDRYLVGPPAGPNPVTLVNTLGLADGGANSFSGGQGYMGQTIESTVAATLTSVTIPIKYGSGSTVGSIGMKLYSWNTGTSKPDAVVATSSTVVTGAELGGTYANKTFVFADVALSANTKYSWQVYMISGNDAAFSFGSSGSINDGTIRSTSSDGGVTWSTAGFLYWLRSQTMTKVVSGGATGGFATHENKIAEYDGSAWVYTLPTLGMFISADDQNTGIHFYGGSAWSFKVWENPTYGSALSLTGTGAGVLNVATGGITTAMIAGFAITDAHIANAAISQSKINGLTAALATAGTGTVTIAANESVPQYSIVKVLTGGVSRRMVKAQADSASNCNGIIGSPQIMGTTAGQNTSVKTSSDMIVSLETSKTLAFGMPVYLSATEAGRVTPDAPTAIGTCVVQVGICLESSVIIFQPVFKYVNA